MTTDDVRFTPAEVNRFADSLEDSLRALRSKQARLADSVAAAKVVWKDEKYDEFQSRLSASLDELRRFDRAGIKYVEFLREKAALGARYLGRR